MAKPEIRLKGFKGEWKATQLDNCVDFLDNMRKPVKEDRRIKGIYPYYGASGIVDYIDDYIFDEELILLSEDGANITDRNYPVCFLAAGKYWVNNHAHVLKAKDGFINSFLSNAMERKDYTQYNTGMAMPKLNKEVCKSIPLSVPTVEEQKAISDYFESLDSMIKATMKKIASLNQMKQACLISMFPQTGETTPRVRFKGFKGKWDIAKLCSIAKRITRKNTQLESTLPLTISAAEGLIEQTSFFNSVVASSNVSGYYLLKKGEFAYNKSYSNGYPFGAVKRLDRYDMGVLSTLYIVFSVNENVSSDYIVHFFDTSLWHKEVAMRAAEGARNHGLLNIGADDFLDIDIILPNSKDEQDKIASFFTSLDRQISLQEQRLEKLKQIKTACLDKLFV